MRSKRLMFLMVELMILSMSDDPETTPMDAHYRSRLERFRQDLNQGKFDGILSHLEHQVFVRPIVYELSRVRRHDQDGVG